MTRRYFFTTNSSRPATARPTGVVPGNLLLRDGSWRPEALAALEAVSAELAGLEANAAPPAPAVVLPRANTATPPESEEAAGPPPPPPCLLAGVEQ